jgi:hypothetical protein
MTPPTKKPEASSIACGPNRDAIPPFGFSELILSRPLALPRKKLPIVSQGHSGGGREERIAAICNLLHNGLAASLGRALGPRSPEARG